MREGGELRSHIFVVLNIFEVTLRDRERKKRDREQQK